MKLSIYTLLFCLFALNAFGQWNNNSIKLSHEITKETKNLTEFNKLDISEDFNVFLRFSDKEESVVIEANENLHDLIKVEKEGETLKIYTKPYSTTGAEETLVAYITAKRIEEIKADEDVVIMLEDKLSSDKLTVFLDEDCTLKGHLEVENLIVKLDEDSVLDITGSAKKMKIKANEDSMVSSFDFMVGDLDIVLKEDSEANLTVNGDIKLRASGDSSFHYQGDGDFSTKWLIGEVEVEKRN